MQQVTTAYRSRRDLAQSRLAFRLQRLWLTPLLRKLVRVGLPMLLALFIIVWGLSDPDRRNAVREQAADLQRTIAERPEFRVNSLVIDGAGAKLSEEIRETLPVDFPVSSFDLDLNWIKSFVEELDAVARADVHIYPGDILHLEVTERIPVVVWRTRNSVELLDVNGYRVATLTSRVDRPDLPLIVGDGAEQAVAEALAVLAAAKPLEFRLRGLVRMGERRWDIVLDRDQRILLPESRPFQALEQAIALNRAKKLLDRDLIAIDMRTARRVTLRIAPQESGELRRIAALKATNDMGSR